MATYADQTPRSETTWSQPCAGVQAPQCHRGGQSAVSNRRAMKSNIDGDPDKGFGGSRHCNRLRGSRNGSVGAEIGWKLAVGIDLDCGGRDERVQQRQEPAGAAGDVELFEHRLLVLDRERQGEAEDVA